MIDKNSFEILNEMYKNNGTVDPLVFCSTRNMPKDLFEETLADLTSSALVSKNGHGHTILPKGFEALRPYKVDNAIIMAAGMSSRFAPLSYEKPKGLLKVKGEVLIEREIKQLQAAGINDITVVVGYLKEQFFYLADRFNVKIVINEDYYKYNNTSTLMRVLDRLSNTYICSSDNYFVDNVFEPYVYDSYYATVFAPAKTDEWCVTEDTDKLITGVKIGGENSWYMLGHVYWNADFSKKFSKILKDEYRLPETKENLWEAVYARHIKELDLYSRHYDRDTVLEFDSLDELRQFDQEYINNADSHILRNICTVLKCQIRDITDIKAIKAGLTNTSFVFSVNTNSYIYRHPGIGTENYINRNSEAFSMDRAAELGLDNTFIYMDKDKGWKISRYVQDARELDYHNEKEVVQALTMMKKLHSQNIKSDFDFGLWNKTLDFIEKLGKLGKTDFDGFSDLLQLMKSVNDKITSDNYTKKCLCHCDCYSPNFLIDNKGQMYLIDWEYSGNDDPASDLGTFICCSEYTYEQSLRVIELYLGHSPGQDELNHYLGYIAEASYYWYVWALYQETRGNPVGEWLYLWYKNSKFFAEKVIMTMEV